MCIIPIPVADSVTGVDISAEEEVPDVAAARAAAANLRRSRSRSRRAALISARVFFSPVRFPFPLAVAPDTEPDRLGAVARAVAVEATSSAVSIHCGSAGVIVDIGTGLALALNNAGGRPTPAPNSVTDRRPTKSGLGGVLSLGLSFATPFKCSSVAAGIARPAIGVAMGAGTGTGTGTAIGADRGTEADSSASGSKRMRTSVSSCAGVDAPDPAGLVYADTGAYA